MDEVQQDSSDSIIEKNVEKINKKSGEKPNERNFEALS